jgi:hypothetical protein
MGYDMAVEAEILFLLSGTISPSGFIRASEDFATRDPTVSTDNNRETIRDVIVSRIQETLDHLLENYQVCALLGEHGSRFGK